jgi:hypothetical protein
LPHLFKGGAAAPLSGTQDEPSQERDPRELLIEKIGTAIYESPLDFKRLVHLEVFIERKIAAMLNSTTQTANQEPETADVELS